MCPICSLKARPKGLKERKASQACRIGEPAEACEIVLLQPAEIEYDVHFVGFGDFDQLPTRLGTRDNKPFFPTAPDRTSTSKS